MDIRKQEKTIYYLGPVASAPDVTASLDGATPIPISANQTTEYAPGQYKTALTAAQMDAGVVVVAVTFEGYQPVQMQIATETDAYASATALSALAGTVEAAKVHTDGLENTDLSAVAKTSDVQTAQYGILDAIPSPSTIAAAVWSAASRTLTGFGTLVSDIWSTAVRTLTSTDKGGLATASDMSALAGEIITTLTPVNAAVVAAAEKAAITHILPSISAVDRTVQISVEGQPVVGCPVWLTQNVAGTVLMSPVEYTDSMGQATFKVKAGQTYYIQAAPLPPVGLPTPYEWKVI